MEDFFADQERRNFDKKKNGDKNVPHSQGLHCSFSFAEKGSVTEAASAAKDQSKVEFDGKRSTELQSFSALDAAVPSAPGDAGWGVGVQVSQPALLSKLFADDTAGPTVLSQSVKKGDVLKMHQKHFFIFTSAGKPVFTRYGDETEIGEIFGVFQVLIAMASRRCDNAYYDDDCVGTEAQRCLLQKGSLSSITAGDLCVYFYLERELFYVLATRTGESACSCMRQLRQVHFQLLSLLPNVNSILSKHSSYDVRRLISSADTAVLRRLIKRNSHEECYLFRCLAAAPLSVRWRRWLESLFTRHCVVALNTSGTALSITKKTEEKNIVATKKQSFFSFLLFRGRIICAMGPANSDASLSVDDTLLLLNFTRCLADTQGGEIWAPFCLPNYDESGYLWCYCVNMSELVRECWRKRTGMVSCDYAGPPSYGQRKHEVLHESNNKTDDVTKEFLGNLPTDFTRADFIESELYLSDMPAAYTRSGGLLLVHVTASPDSFLSFSEQTNKMALLMTAAIVPIEKELSRRENISLSIVASREELTRQQQKQEVLPRLDVFDAPPPPLSPQQQPTPLCSSQFCHSAHPNSSGDFLSLHSFTHPDGLHWFAAVFTGLSGRNDVPAIVYSEPSLTMRLSSRERKRQLRLLVQQRDKLCQVSGISEPLILTRMKDLNLVVMRTTHTFVESLVQQLFLQPLSPNKVSGSEEEAFVSLKQAVAACDSIRELMLLFLPHVPNSRMLRCALHVLVRIVAREGELTFKQLRGGMK